AYRQTLFQLAFASLCRRAGAAIVRLEPETVDGRFADLEVSVAGASVHVECFRPTVDVADNDEPIRMAQQALHAAIVSDTVLSVAIALHVELTPAVRRKVVAVVRRLAGFLAEGGKATSEHRAKLVHTSVATVSVARSLPSPPGARTRLVVAPGFSRQAGHEEDMFT